MLLPWWGGDNPDPSDPDSGRFTQWKKDGPAVFTMVDRLEDADFAIYPSSPTADLRLFERFQQLASGDGKRTIAFFNDDNDTQIPFGENTWLFRTSFYKSDQRAREFALAAWAKDRGPFSPAPWSDKPKVSFCGTFDDFGVRASGAHALKSHPDVDTDFIVRRQFWGGWIGSGRKEEVGKRVREEFRKNMASGGYVLCGRGGGNFSYRIYETMMSGRIPVLVDSDCVLPYDFEINWASLFPIVPFANVAKLGDKLMEFHQGLGPGGFSARQDEMRRIWEDRLSPTGYFSNLHRHFEETK